MNILIYLNLFVAFALALPTPQGQEPCKALIETSPWQISNIVVFNNLPTAPTGSSIHFHISDKNPGLEFKTECGVSLPQGTGARPEEAQGWHPCDNDQVRFLYRPGNLQIRRSYIDDCLGKPPYNGGAFYGNADTGFQVTSTTDGEVWTQTGMEMPATSQTS